MSDNSKPLYSWVVCCECGIRLGMPRDFNDMLHRTHATFYCPVGHGNYYPQKSKEEQLREELEAEQRHSKWLQSNRDAIERRRQAARGQLTKLKRRVGDGKCPCCNRTFHDLGAHMQREHPDYGN
jgi:hypothetical protein